MILVGIDDTDVLEGEGTNRLARRIADALPAGFRFRAILRHQLLVDPRIPYTSHNGSASLLLDGPPDASPDALAAAIERTMRARFQPGSDPGLCVALEVPPPVRAWGPRCQREVVTQAQALELARAHGLLLRGLGGTNGGVIGALAAVALAAAGEDGRVVHMAGWPWPDELRGLQPIEAVHARGVAEVRVAATGDVVAAGEVDVGKHLRPAWRGGRPVLLVERRQAADGYVALKLP